jgi:hypothetical protein
MDCANYKPKIEIEEQIHKRIEVQRQLDELKLEHTCEVWLLKQEIKNLEEKNKAQRKTHQGNSLPSPLAKLNIVGK